jgi:hypothetical protein
VILTNCVLKQGLILCKLLRQKMKNIITIIVFLLLPVAGLMAQEKTKLFLLDASKEKRVSASLYSSVDFLDSRENKVNLGVVRVGTLDKEAAVIPQEDFQLQLNKVVAGLVGDEALPGKLLFQLRKLKFIEKAEGNLEYGYCFFRASVYTPVESNRYKQIAAIDTFISVESRDVTNLIMESANKAIVRFMASSLQKDTLFKPIYTYNDIVRIDSIEKSRIKVYNVAEYTDGIYSSFESFKEQLPDYSLFSITFEDGEITEIKGKNQKGRILKLKSDEVYAMVNKGQPYISAQFGYYPLVKNNNDFYFIGDDKQHYIKGQLVKSNSLLNPVEYLYSPLPLTSTFEIKIDHINGKFMRVKEVK